MQFEIACISHMKVGGLIQACFDSRKEDGAKGRANWNIYPLPYETYSDSA